MLEAFLDRSNMLIYLYQQMSEVSQPVHHDNKSQATLGATLAERQDRLSAAASVWQADTLWECVIKAVMGSPLTPHLQVDQ